MNSIHAIALLSAAIALLSGCAGKPPPQPSARQPSPVMGAAAVTAYKANVLVDQTQAARPMPVGEEPQAVRTQDTIVEIELEPYIDENGNAYGPQKKYMIAKNGEWNRAALRNPTNSYIPVVNLETIPGPATYTPYLSPGSVQSSTPTSDTRKVKTLADLYDVKNVTVTGLVERSQGPQAQKLAETAGGDLIAVYDEALGWILIPKANLVLGQQTLRD